MKATTKELHTEITVNRSHTTMPLHLRQATAEGIQAERPWSSLPPDEIVEDMYNQTADGCLDVYVYSGETLVGWAHIGARWDIHVGPMCYILAMYVPPEYRHMGVPRVIIRELKQAARDVGYRWCGYGHWTKPRRLTWQYIDLGESHG